MCKINKTKECQILKFSQSYVFISYISKNLKINKISKTLSSKLFLLGVKIWAALLNKRSTGVEDGMVVCIILLACATMLTTAI
jgi:hypothetical protein